MKALFISSLLLAGTSVFGMNRDSVVMTVAGKPVSIDEFVFMAEKNGAVNLSDRKERDSFVELYKNFKLKVAEAEAEGLDKTKSFAEELDEYRSQLTADFLSDKEGEDAAVRVEFERMKEMVECSHILFRLPEQTLSRDTAAVYQQALEAYRRIQGGEDFVAVAKECVAQAPKKVAYEHVYRLHPMQTIKAFENQVFTMPVGSVSAPVRTKLGYHIIRLENRLPNPGKIKVAHILLAFPKNATAADTAKVKADAEQLYAELQAGADFAEKAKTLSADPKSAARGGMLPAFDPGTMVREFEDAAYKLKTPGELSQPVESRFGYHIIKLIEAPKQPDYAVEKKRLTRLMAQGERNFELYKAFDDKMKQEYGYEFYPEAYAELQALCNDYFPTDTAFYNRAREMKKPLFRLDGEVHLQDEFAYYIQRCPFSAKTYAGDFMQEVYDLFVRELATISERKNLKKKHPEFDLLMGEYRDGILLFEISNRRIWSKPMSEQKALDEAWIAELNEKYPVTINWEVLDKAVGR